MSKLQPLLAKLSRARAELLRAADQISTPQWLETMLAQLRSVRERTLAFLEETQHRDLSAYSWRHPFLDRLDFYDWFAFLAAHEIRHSKQMWEIGQILRKGVASSRK